MRIEVEIIDKFILASHLPLCKVEDLRPCDVGAICRYCCDFNSY